LILHAQTSGWRAARALRSRHSARVADGPTASVGAWEAARPSLQVGRGGRDGETGDLREFLAWVLAGKVPQD